MFERKPWLRKWKRTKKGLTSVLHSMQRNNGSRSRHGMPKYSVQELREWCYAQPKFHMLHEKWFKSGYLKSMRPSIDRINTLDGYVFENIQLMTWGENEAKGHKEKGLTQGKKVNQLTKEGKYVKTFISLMEAGRKTGAFHENICKVLKGHYKTAGGYKWEYA